jgi:hypothetical protein
MKHRTVTQEVQMLREEFRLSRCRDAWEDTVHWFYTVADDLHTRVGFTPPHWEYIPSSRGPSNDPDDHAAALANEVGTETLVKFGEVLYRYARALRSAGLDYSDESDSPSP